MLCKYVFCRFPQWSHSPLGTTPSTWGKLLKLSGKETTVHWNVGLFLLGLHSLIFPRWDVIAIILAMFLMTYTYIEAKSNYHRGSILILRCVFLIIPTSSFLLTFYLPVIWSSLLDSILPHPQRWISIKGTSTASQTPFKNFLLSLFCKIFDGT